MSLSLDDSIQFLKSVGPKKAELFSSVGIKSVKDLLYYFPFKYLDRTKIIKSNQLIQYLSKGFDGEVTLVASVYSKEIFYFGKKRMMKVVMRDDEGFFDLVWFRGIEYFKDKFNEGDFYAVSGKPVLTRYNHIQIVHPDFDRLENSEAQDYIHTGRIIPFYRIPDKLRKNKLGDLSIRKLIFQVVEKYSDLVEENLPLSLIEQHNIFNINSAIKNLHFPESNDSLKRAFYRMKLEELFYFELMMAIRRHKIKNVLKGNSFRINIQSVKKLLLQFPFQLTSSQLEVLTEIRNDLESSKPMNRLLQGDVGSGKTVVALICLLIVSSNNMRSVLLAPTEILAQQHFKTISNYLKDFAIEIILIIGGMTNKEKENATKKIVSSENCIIIGTHALFEENIRIDKLGLVVIDEQHKFGVLQRSKIISKGKSPDVLIMTATPIPRTLSLTVFGDLDVSVIKQLPTNRKPIKTVLRYEKDLDNIYMFIKSRIDCGEQTFIVYPAIEDNEKSELKSAEKYFSELSQSTFKNYRMELLHGKMNAEKKDNIMNDFLNKKFDILISTSVIEVGIDIANATVILINNAERFGLSQLHQMRGRVGRGDKQSYCILVTSNKTEKNNNLNFEFNFLSKQQIEKHKTMIRLNSMVKYSDGFKLAEIDLKLRGPGDIFGLKQSGIPEFVFADLTTDLDILETARQNAFELIDFDPNLSAPESSLIKKHLDENLTRKGFYIRVG
jgi:ATP-dependent DNA helicase RecG